MCETLLQAADEPVSSPPIFPRCPSPPFRFFPAEAPVFCNLQCSGCCLDVAFGCLVGSFQPRVPGLCAYCSRACVHPRPYAREERVFPPPVSHGRLLGDPWSSLGEASPHATSCVLHLSSPPGSSEEGRVGVSDPSCISVGYLQSETPSHPVPRGGQSRGLFSSTDSKEAQVLHLHPRLFPDRLVFEGGDKPTLLHFKPVADADGVAAHVHVGGESCQISDGLDVAFEGGSVSDEVFLLNAPFNSDLGTTPKPAGAHDARLGGFQVWGAPNREDAHDALHSNYERVVPETLWKKAHFSHAGDLEWVDGPSYYPSLRKNQFLHKDGSASVSSTVFARAFSGLTGLTPCKHCSFCSGPRDLCAQHQRECRDFADVCLKVLQQEPHMWQLAEVHVDVSTLCLACLQSKYNKATSAPRPSIVTGPKFFPSAFLEDQGDMPTPWTHDDHEPCPSNAVQLATVQSRSRQRNRRKPRCGSSAVPGPSLASRIAAHLTSGGALASLEPDVIEWAEQVEHQGEDSLDYLVAF